MRRRGSPEDLFDDAQHVDRGEKRSGDCWQQPPRVGRAPGAEERQQLGDEAGRGGQTQRREAGHGEGRGDSGHDAPEPAHLSDLTRVGLLVDEAHEREAESGHDAVGEHLEDGAIQARLGQRGRPQHDDTHVGDGRVRDDVFQVGLRHRRQRAVHDIDAGDHADQPGEISGARRQQSHAHPHDTVGAELHQHAGVKHRDRRRRRSVAIGRPRVQRPDTGEDPESDVEGQEHPALEATIERHALEVEERERADAGRCVQGEDSDQDERRTEEQIERQLHRRVLFRPDTCLAVRPGEDAARPNLAGRAPDSDQQVHRQHGELVEQEEHEEVEGDEHTEDAGDQRQQQRVELLTATGHRPRREHAREDDDAGQQDHQKAHAIDSQLVVDPQWRHQRQLLVELEAARLSVVGDVEPERERCRDPGGDGRDEADGPGAMTGGEHDQQCAHERGPRDERQHGDASGHRGELRDPGSGRTWRGRGVIARTGPRRRGGARRRRRHTRSPEAGRSASAGARRPRGASTRSAR